MNKFLEIAKAFIAAANPTPEQKSIAEYRTSVCDACPNKKHLRHFDEYVCGLCNCLLEKKVFSPVKNSCPDNRWEK